MTDKNDDAEKTEAPTEHRLKKAKEEGQIMRFPMVSMLAALLGGMGALAHGWIDMSEAVKKAFSASLVIGHKSHWPDDRGVGGVLIDYTWIALKCVLPFLVTVFMVCLILTYLSSGWSISFRRVQMDLNRCHPMQGFQQWLSNDAWIKSGGAVVKCLLVIGVFIGLLATQYEPILRVSQYTVKTGINQIVPECFRMILMLISPLMLCTLVEVWYQRWSFLKKMKMSKSEVKEAYKQEEGRPELKAKMKQFRRQIFFENATHQIKNATILITDGYQISVMLRYVDHQDVAPWLIAKGYGVLSISLQQAAAQYGVPRITQASLAKQLFLQGVKGRLIPRALYGSVAHVLAQVTPSTSQKTGG